MGKWILEKIGEVLYHSSESQLFFEAHDTYADPTATLALY